MTRYRTLLVDDEGLALDRLERLLAAHAERIEVVGRAKDGPEALEQIEALQPELVFLDIQMPGFSGFEVLSRLEQTPWIIFCTAYDAYALKAFEACALDYLLKPIAPARLGAALDKLGRLEPQQRDGVAGQLQVLVEHLQKPAAVRLPVRQGDRTRFVEVAQVRFFRAADKYVEAHTYDELFLLDTPLNQLEKTLPAADFARIHRSYLVNLAYLEEVVHHLGSYRAKVGDRDQSELPISRGGRGRLGL